MQDADIVELYLRRDETAIARTAEKYGIRLRQLAFGIVQDAQTGEECENDTYLEAWRSIPPHAPGTYLYPFLARITRHIALNCCRSRKQLKRDADVQALSAELEQCLPGSDNTAEQVDGILLAQSISAFLWRLPAVKRNLFVRRYWYLDSIEEIAGRFHMGHSRVKTTLFRTRNALRHYLEQEGYSI